jgi:hypothetical protein
MEAEHEREWRYQHEHEADCSFLWITIRSSGRQPDCAYISINPSQFRLTSRRHVHLHQDNGIILDFISINSLFCTSMLGIFENDIGLPSSFDLKISNILPIISNHSLCLCYPLA